MTKSSYEEPDARTIKTVALELGVDELFKRWKAAEAELLRVRGLLQQWRNYEPSPRQRFYNFLRERDAWKESDRSMEYGELILKCIEAALSGAESADIGKLDRVDEKMCKCGHSDEEHDDGRLCCTHRKSASLFCSCNEFVSAETGGEKAAPWDGAFYIKRGDQYQCQFRDMILYVTNGGVEEKFAEQWCADFNKRLVEHNAEMLAEKAKELAARVWMRLTDPEPPNFPRSSQNQTVSSGVEGAHEGTTADKSEPEKLNNAEYVSGLLWKLRNTAKGALRDAEREADAWLAESSLSSPPPERFMCTCGHGLSLHDAECGGGNLKCSQCQCGHATVRQSSSLSKSGAESVHSGKKNTADKSELLPTQLPKE